MKVVSTTVRDKVKRVIDKLADSNKISSSRMINRIIEEWMIINKIDIEDSIEIPENLIMVDGIPGPSQSPPPKSGVSNILKDSL